MNARLMSKTRWVAENGGDIEDVLHEIADETEMEEDYSNDPSNPAIGDEEVF